MAKFTTAVLVCLFVGLCFLMCSQPEPANFKVISAVAKPDQIFLGESVKVNVQIQNTGGMPGTHKFNLLVDGVLDSTKEVTLDSGKLQSLEFKLDNSNVGTHVVSVDNASSTFGVRARSVTKEVELKYGNKEVGGTVVGVLGGFLVEFSPPVAPFTINKVRILGMLPSTIGGEVDLELWTTDRNIIYRETFTDTRFPHKTDLQQMSGGKLTKWTEFQIPDITVTDKFYVHLWKGVRTGGLHLAYDDTTENQHSSITTLAGEKIVESSAWSQKYFCPCSYEEKPRCNWMIRVTGKGDFPNN
jgi:hypothetical protein